MKERILFSLVLLLSISLVSYGNQRFGLSYRESFSYGLDDEIMVCPILNKSKRLNKNAGVIEITTDNLPDSMIMCIRAAADIWQSVLCNPKPITLHFSGALKALADVEISVGYYQKDSRAFPASYYYNFISERSEFERIPDALIDIHLGAGWSCDNTTEAVHGEKNLTFAMLRSIGITLGFGSSVTSLIRSGEQIIHFGTNDGYSPCDYLIFSSSGKRLVDIPNIGRNLSLELNKFVTDKDNSGIYVLKMDADHLLYTPPYYCPYKSMIYLNNPKSLMFYDLLYGAKILSIDDVTIEILNAIGWNIPRSNIELNIVGIGIEDNGLASAYANHSFTIDNPSGATLVDCEGSYALTLKDGTRKEIKRSLGEMTFEIPAIDDENKYEININGDIYGFIEFHAKCNGEDVYASYKISLELKPRILNVQFLSQKFDDNQLFYDLYYKVEYCGSDYIEIEMESEYNPVLLVNRFSEPFLAHAVTKSLPVNYDSWIYIKVKNKYGTVTKTLSFPAGWSIENDIFKIKDIEKSDGIHVYDAFGSYIMTTASENELSGLKKGIYILNYIEENQVIKTVKYFKK